MYLFGKGVEKDTKKAYDYFSKVKQYFLSQLEIVKDVKKEILRRNLIKTR